MASGGEYACTLIASRLPVLWTVCTRCGPKAEPRPRRRVARRVPVRPSHQVSVSSPSSTVYAPDTSPWSCGPRDCPGVQVSSQTSTCSVRASRRPQREAGSKRRGAVQLAGRPGGEEPGQPAQVGRGPVRARGEDAGQRIGRRRRTDARTGCGRRGRRWSFGRSGGGGRARRPGEDGVAGATRPDRRRRRPGGGPPGGPATVLSSAHHLPYRISRGSGNPRSASGTPSPCLGRLTRQRAEHRAVSPSLRGGLELLLVLADPAEGVGVPDVGDGLVRPLRAEVARRLPPARRTSTPYCLPSSATKICAFCVPKPGSAPSRLQQLRGRRSRVVQTFVTSPSYRSTTARHIACTRFAIDPGNRCNAGGFEKIATRSSSRHTRDLRRVRHVPQPLAPARTGWRTPSPTGSADQEPCRS